MGYLIDMRDTVIRTFDSSFYSFRGGIDDLVGKVKNEFYYLKDKKDLYVKNRELRYVIDDLNNVKNECYCERGVIYRRDIRDVMHRVAIINIECGKIRKDMDARRMRGNK